MSALAALAWGTAAVGQQPMGIVYETNGVKAIDVVFLGCKTNNLFEAPRAECSVSDGTKPSGFVVVEPSAAALVQEPAGLEMTLTVRNANVGTPAFSDVMAYTVANTPANTATLGRLGLGPKPEAQVVPTLAGMTGLWHRDNSTDAFIIHRNSAGFRYDLGGMVNFFVAIDVRSGNCSGHPRVAHHIVAEFKQADGGPQCWDIEGFTGDTLVVTRRTLATRTGRGTTAVYRRQKN